MTDRTIILTKDNGEEIEGIILFTYFYEKTNKNYVIYQIKGTNDVVASIYYPEGKEGKLDPVETDEEWAMLEDLLNDYVNQQEEESSGCAGCSGCGGDCDCDGECDCDDGECSQ